jgi:alanine dehydrogenase
VIIGCPTEVKVHEYRVGLVPAGVIALKARGHRVLVQAGAGLGSGIGDDAYASRGAEVVASAADVWSRADLIIKVKEPTTQEYPLIREGQVIYTYFHLAAVPDLTRMLVARRVTAVAYETIQTADGALPLLAPMSEVAGRMAIQVGATCLERERGGKGVLLGGVPGVRRGRVVILGGGTVGTNAAKIAVGLGAEVTLLDISLPRLRQLDDQFGSHVTTLYSNPTNIHDTVVRADLVVGAVLIPGARAPQLVDEALVREMEDGSVVVDVAVDQGGCIATCRPTTHEDPTYVLHGVLHYCVANMPGAVAQTSTYALTNATIPHALKIADRGVLDAAKADEALSRGINTLDGKVTCKPVADSLAMEYVPLPWLRRP